MRMCADHWAKLKAALEARGLGDLMAKSQEDVQRRMEAAMVQGDPAKSFEPLLGAHNAILANALDTVGMQLMEPNADGSERCPICFLKTCPCGNPECAPKFERWIEHAADDALTEAKRLGLVTVQ